MHGFEICKDYFCQKVRTSFDKNNFRKIKINIFQRVLFVPNVLLLIFVSFFGIRHAFISKILVMIGMH